MDQIKSNLKAVVGSSKSGIPLMDLENEYKRITNTFLNYRNYNFKNIQSFIVSMRDVVRLDYVGSTLMVFLMTTSSDPPCLKNLCNLIQHTKSKKNPKYNNSIPQNVVAKANYNNLMISVSNERCGFNSNGQHQKNGNYNARNRTWNSSSPSSSSPTVSKKDDKMPVIKEDPMPKEEPVCKDVPLIKEAPVVTELPPVTSNWNSHTRLVNNSSLCNGSGDGSTQNETLLWPLHFDISISVLHKPAKILGIQSGYALVSIMDQTQTQNQKYVETTPYTNGFPGDSYLWQPPHTDPSRPQSSVDTSTVFPVIILLRINSDVIKVRVSGLRVLLDVNIRDLHRFPKSKAVLVKLRSVYQSRQVTLVRMALVPEYFNTWDPSLFHDIFFAPIALNETDFVFERCQKRGDFLNTRLLVNCVTHVLPQLIMPKRIQFVEIFKFQMDECKKALVAAFKEMCDDKNPRPTSGVSNVLSYIFDIDDCTNRLLLGCPSLFSSSSRSPGPVAKDLTLERVVYRPESKSFHLLDNCIKVSVAWSSPLFGLYVLNEAFVNSHIVNLTNLRFQAAFLLHMPSPASIRTALSQS